MKPIHVAATIVRLFAIGIFVYVLSLISFAFAFTHYEESWSPILLSLFIIFILITLGIFLWNFPLTIARKITNIPEESDDQSFSISADEFASICFFTLGLYLLYEVCGDIIYWIRLLNDPIYQQMGQETTASQDANLWALGFRSMLVLFLLVGNQRLIDFARWLRHAG